MPNATTKNLLHMSHRGRSICGGGGGEGSGRGGGGGGEGGDVLWGGRGGGVSLCHASFRHWCKWLNLDVRQCASKTTCGTGIVIVVLRWLSRTSHLAQRMLIAKACCEARRDPKLVKDGGLGGGRPYDIVLARRDRPAF